MTTNKYSFSLLLSSLYFHQVEAETMLDAYNTLKNKDIDLSNATTSLYYELPDIPSDCHVEKYENEPIGAYCFVQFPYEPAPTCEYVSFGFVNTNSPVDKYGVWVEGVWKFLTSEAELMFYTDKSKYDDEVTSYWVISYRLKYKNELIGVEASTT